MIWPLSDSVCLLFFCDLTKPGKTACFITYQGVLPNNLRTVLVVKLFYERCFSKQSTISV